MRSPAQPENEISSLFLGVCPKSKTEDSRQYQAFTDYCLLNFSLAELDAHYKKNLETNPDYVIPASRKEMDRWSKMHRWNERRGNYLIYRTAKREKEINAIDENNQLRISRINQTLLARVEEMLQAPLFKETIEERILVTSDMVGEYVPVMYTMQPLDWDMGDISSTLNTFCTLQREQSKRLENAMAVVKKATKDGTELMSAGEAIEVIESIPTIGEAM